MQNYCRALTLWAENVAGGIVSPGHVGDVRHKPPSVVGIAFVLQTFDEAVPDEDAPTSIEAAMRTLVQKGVDVLIAPYSSGLTARAAVAVSQAAAAQFAAAAADVHGQGNDTHSSSNTTFGSNPDLDPHHHWPAVPLMLSAGAAAESVYTCTDKMEYPCTRPYGRRFPNVFTLLSPGAKYFQGLVELAAAQRSAGIAIVYETGGYAGNLFSKSVSNGARAHARSLGVEILIEIGMTIDTNVAETTIKVADDDAAGTLDAPTSSSSSAYPRFVVTAPEQIAGSIAIAETLKPVVNAEAHKVAGNQGGVVVVAVTQKEISCEHLLASLTAFGVEPASIGLTVCSTQADFPALLQSLNNRSFVTGPSQWDSKLKGPDYKESSAGTSPVHHFASDTVPSPMQFELAFEERWGGVSPTYHTASVMAAVYMLEDAIQATGAHSLARDLGTALHHVRMTSFFGTLHFNTIGVVEER